MLTTKALFSQKNPGMDASFSLAPDNCPKMIIQLISSKELEIMGQLNFKPEITFPGLYGELPDHYLGKNKVNSHPPSNIRTYKLPIRDATPKILKIQSGTGHMMLLPSIEITCLTIFKEVLAANNDISVEIT